MPENKNKQILTAIKQEFQQDEKILENAFKLERFVKKYKYWLIALLAMAIVWLGYRTIYDIMQENRAQKISALYNELLQNPNNELLQAQLKAQAKELYDLYQLSHIDSIEQAQTALQELTLSTNPLVKQLATYNLASLTRKDFDKVSGDLVDFATIQKAYLLLRQDKIQEARALLDAIKIDSTLYGIATQMKHYGIIKFPISDTLTIKEVQTNVSSDSASTDSAQANSTQTDSGQKSAGASK